LEHFPISLVNSVRILAKRVCLVDFAMLAAPLLCHACLVFIVRLGRNSLGVLIYALLVTIVMALELTSCLAMRARTV
jgi:hypothetical protein